MRDDYERLNREVPLELFPPEILQGYESWFEDFWELGTDRALGNALGPIPAASIDRHVNGWDSREATAFRLVIRALDGVYLAHVNKPPTTTPGKGSPMTDSPHTVDRSKPFTREMFRAGTGR